MDSNIIESNNHLSKEPLAETNANVTSVKPVSKIPAFGFAAGGSHLRPPSSIPSMNKRKNDKEEVQMSKRQKFDPSPETTLVVSPCDKVPVNKALPPVTKPVVSRNTRQTTVSVKPTAVKGPIKPAPKNPPTAFVPKVACNAPALFVFKGAPQNPASTAKPPVAGKKRPAWDTKGRLEDMEAAMSRHLEQNSNLQGQILQSNDRIASLESLNCQLKGTVQQSEQLTNQANNEIMSLQRRLREKEEELESATSRFSRQLADVEFSRSTLERQKTTLESELAVARQEIAGLKSTIAQMSSAQAGIEAELSAIRVSLEASRRSNEEKDTKIASLEMEIRSHVKTIEDANCKIRSDEMLRRKLHNTILELKGNIRVFTRVRPLLGAELLGSNGEIHHIHFPDNDNSLLELEKLADANPNESTTSIRRGIGGKYEFKFDHVFGPSATQQEVFEEISQLVQSALDGYNVCIFAYGQTGSGKTFTMEGGPITPGSNKDQRGMIPRAVTQIFATSNDLTDKGWKYEFEVTFLEIYNETIRDLLGCGKDDARHEVRMIAPGSSEVFVTNLTTVKVANESQVHELLLKASHNRSVAETKCNERSSRSHSVFRLRITGHNSVTDESCCGLLNLIDLAGSERLKDSGSEGVRLKETQSINKSLANLGNVIMALANKEPHIPYRNSKLTHLLQNCLGGSSKTLMFVNVSPKEECFQETLNSLRFATKVNECNIGTAQKRIK